MSIRRHYIILYLYITSFFALSTFYPGQVVSSLCNSLSNYLNLHNPGEGSFRSTGPIPDVERVAGRVVDDVVLIAALRLEVTLHRGVLLGEPISAAIWVSSDSGVSPLVRSPHSLPHHGRGEERCLVSV